MYVISNLFYILIAQLFANQDLVYICQVRIAVSLDGQYYMYDINMKGVQKPTF